MHFGRGLSCISSADAGRRQGTALNCGNLGGEVDVADAAGAADDLALGVLALGAEPDVLELAALVDANSGYSSPGQPHGFHLQR